MEYTKEELELAKQQILICRNTGNITPATAKIINELLNEALILPVVAKSLPDKEEKTFEEDYYIQKHYEDLRWQEKMNGLYEYGEDGFCDGFAR